MSRTQETRNAEMASRVTMMGHLVRRRSLLGGALGLAGTLALAGKMPRVAGAQDAALPDDAAPADQQVFVMVNNIPVFEKEVVRHDSCTWFQFFS